MPDPVTALTFGQKLGQSAVSQSSTGLLGGLFGQIFAGANARRQWKYQKKAMALQQQYALEQMAKSAEYQLTHDKELFDYQNAYNEPTKVFERYAAAGINPAAVLGSSGVGVSATVPTGSGSAPSASGPTGGASPLGLANVSSDPLAFAQIEMADANTDRARAAASRDSAEADLIRNQTQSKEYYAAVAELNKSIVGANVGNANAVADMNRALATVYQADAEYADLMATYKFEDYIAQYATHVEEYNQLKKYGVEYMDKVLSSQIVLDLARAYQSFNSGQALAIESEISKVRLADLQNWFTVNWETEIPVPIIDVKGKPTGKTKLLTGKDIHSYLMGLSVTHSNQETASNWFNNRSEKNALGYSMLNAVIHGAAGLAASYYGGKAMGKGFATTGSERSVIEHYGAGGEFVGGTRIQKEMLSNRDRR